LLEMYRTRDVKHAKITKMRTNFPMRTVIEDKPEVKPESEGPNCGSNFLTLTSDLLDIASKSAAFNNKRESVEHG